MSHASIIPLIGGETIAMQNVFGEKPEYILSYTDFEANDNQLVAFKNNGFWMPMDTLREKNILNELEKNFQKEMKELGYM